MRNNTINDRLFFVLRNSNQQFYIDFSAHKGNCTDQSLFQGIVCHLCSEENGSPMPSIDDWQCLLERAKGIHDDALAADIQEDTRSITSTTTDTSVDSLLGTTTKLPYKEDPFCRDYEYGQNEEVSSLHRQLWEAQQNVRELEMQRASLEPRIRELLEGHGNSYTLAADNKDYKRLVPTYKELEKLTTDLGDKVDQYRTELRRMTAHKDDIQSRYSDSMSRWSSERVLLQEKLANNAENTDLAELRQQLDAAQTALRFMQNSLQRETVRSRTLADEVQRLTDSCKHTDARCDGVAQELSSAQKEVSELRQLVQNLREADCSYELQSMNKKFASLQTRAKATKEALQQDLFNWQNKAESASLDAKASWDAHAKADADVQRLQIEMNRLQQHLGAAQAERDQAHAEVQTLKAGLKAAQDVAADFQADVQRLEGDLNASQADAADAKADVQTLKADLKAAQDELAQANAEVQTLKADLKTAQDGAADDAAEMKKLKGNLGSALFNEAFADGKVQAMQATIDALQSNESGQVDIALIASNTEVQRLQDDLKASQAGAADARAELQGLQAKLDAATEDLAQQGHNAAQLARQLRNAKDKAAHDLAGMNARLDDALWNENKAVDNAKELEQRLAETDSKLAEASKGMTTTDQEYAKLQEELRKKVRECCEFKEDIRELKAKIARMERVIQSLNEQIEDMRDGSLFSSSTGTAPSFSAVVVGAAGTARYGSESGEDLDDAWALAQSSVPAPAPVKSTSIVFGWPSPKLEDKHNAYVETTGLSVKTHAEAKAAADEKRAAKAAEMAAAKAAAAEALILLSPRSRTQRQLFKAQMGAARDYQAQQ